MSRDTEPTPQSEIITLDETALERFGGITEAIADDFSRFTRDVALRDGTRAFYTTVGRTFMKETLERGQKKGQELTEFMISLDNTLRVGNEVVITREDPPKSESEKRSVYTFSVPHSGRERKVGGPEAEIVIDALLPSTFSPIGIQIDTKANKLVKERMMGAFERGANVELKYTPPQTRARK